MKPSERWRRAAVPLVLLALMCVVLAVSYGYDREARALPVLVASTTIVLLALEILVQADTRIGRRIARLLAGKALAPEPERAPLGRALVQALVWPGLVLALTVLLGLLPAVGVYVWLSLRINAGLSLGRAALAAAAVTAGCWLLFEWAMSYELYRGLIWERLLG